MHEEEKMTQKTSQTIRGFSLDQQFYRIVQDVTWSDALRGNI